jgi:carbon-monoxide dehydrogenase medium subunit
MALAHAFEYVKPATLKEATHLLARHGARARVLAGGTDLIGLIADDFAHPAVVVDIKGIPGLDGLAYRDGTLTIGALVTFSALRESPVVARAFPVLREMTTWVASAGIRNRATVLGNLCSAVPCLDSAPVLLLFESAVRVTGPRGRRSIPLEEWFVAPRRTALRKGEVATAVTVTRPREKHAACYLKLRRYRGEDLAQVGVAVMALRGHRYRVAFGAVAPTPVRGARIERLLDGQPLSDERVRQAVALVPREIAPITDIRATKEYRLHMAGVMLERGLAAAAARLEGRGPDYGTDLVQP